MKGKTLVLSLAAIMLVIANSVASLAYFTDSDSSSSTFTLGNINIQAVPTFIGYDSGGQVDESACSVLSSGKKCIRTISIKNTSTVPIYVKAEIVLDEKTGDMMEELNSKDGLLNFQVNAGDFVPQSANFNFLKNYGRVYTNSYLYTQIIAPGATCSTPISYTVANNSSPKTEIDVDDQPEEGGSYNSTELGIKTYIYAIQADGFASAAEAFANY